MIGEGNYDERVLIVYSGIRKFFFCSSMCTNLVLLYIDYDALALAPMSDSPMDFDQTQFSVSDEYILKASKELVDGLRKV